MCPRDREFLKASLFFFRVPGRPGKFRLPPEAKQSLAWMHVPSQEGGSLAVPFPISIFGTGTDPDRSGLIPGTGRFFLLDKTQGAMSENPGPSSDCAVWSTRQEVRDILSLTEGRGM
ncbi:hypothetical protein ABH19_00765 [Leptospirillum sp. Group II 'CF-1']|nr:hypothetical protein ABH19_00765 [Leptospirillum sp. Group II 'CF-1']